MWHRIYRKILKDKWTPRDAYADYIEEKAMIEEILELMKDGKNCN